MIEEYKIYENISENRRKHFPIKHFLIVFIILLLTASVIMFLNYKYLGVIIYAVAIYYYVNTYKKYFKKVYKYYPKKDLFIYILALLPLIAFTLFFYNVNFIVLLQSLLLFILMLISDRIERNIYKLNKESKI